MPLPARKPGQLTQVILYLVARGPSKPYLALACNMPTKNNIGIPMMSAHCNICIKFVMTPSGPVAAEAMILQMTSQKYFIEGLSGVAGNILKYVSTAQQHKLQSMLIKEDFFF